jgi:hypothetical protein
VWATSPACVCLVGFRAARHAHLLQSASIDFDLEIGAGALSLLWRPTAALFLCVVMCVFSIKQSGSIEMTFHLGGGTSTQHNTS